ncbi:MAG: hypothetical protein OEV43_05170 [Coriobacteriia bacterium]|nr:hypothetical protein [Coriobacteriia bacterium]
MESAVVTSLIIDGSETLRRPAFWDAEGDAGRIVVVDPATPPRLWTELAVTAITADGRRFQGKARAVATFTYFEGSRGTGVNQVTVSWIGKPKPVA